jgi:hypothetical protein
MKNLVTFLMLMFLTLSSFSQNNTPKKITVDLKVGQNMEWPSTMTLLTAKENNLIEYPNYVVGNNTFIFDIVNKKCFKKYENTIIEFKILSMKKNKFGYYFDIEVNGFDNPSKIAITEKKEGGYIFLVQHSSNYGDEKLEATFTESKDMSITYQN